jgi:hypothetical protein
MKFFLTLTTLLGLAAGPTLANDSVAEIALGGLTLSTTDSISMDSEDLYLSKEEVRVKYRFTNTTDKDIETLVAFPLPDQAYDENGDGYFHDMNKELAFKTLVDGQPVSYDVVVQALQEGKDITQRIEATGLPLNTTEDVEAFTAKVLALPEADRKALLEEGLIADQGVNGQPWFISTWSLRTTVTRKQVFPSKKTVSVEHSYTPLVGGSVGGSLNKEYRNEDFGKDRTRLYCIEDGWYAAFDKSLAARATAEVASPYSEWWIGYVLKSGANWKGPIKDFRLVVDKGKPDSLVSFCAEGVKKISDTQFEVKKTNFEPKEDLSILIVEWYDPNAVDEGPAEDGAAGEGTEGE